MRFLMIVLSFALVFLCVPQGNAEQLRIATWNIKNLHSDFNQGKTPRSEEDYARLKGYADRLDADIIALQEIYDKDAIERVFDPNVYEVRLEGRRGRLLNGFAYKKDIGFKIRTSPDVRALDVGKQRHGVDLTIEVGKRKSFFRRLFGGAAEIRVLGVHLKSFCWDSPLDTDNADCARLKLQAPPIKRWIDRRAREGAPYIVLGTFNRFDVPQDEFWQVIDSAALPLTRLNEGPQGCWSSQATQFVDYIGVGDIVQDWIVSGSFQALVYDESDRPFGAELSDHCPLYFEIDIPDSFEKSKRPGFQLVRDEE